MGRRRIQFLNSLSLRADEGFRAQMRAEYSNQQLEPRVGCNSFRARMLKRKGQRNKDEPCTKHSLEACQTERSMEREPEKKGSVCDLKKKESFRNE